MQIYHPKNETTSLATGILIGTGISLAITTVLAAILTTMILSEKTRIDTMPYFTFMITLLSAMVGSIVAGKYAKGKTAIVCGICGLCYGAIMLFTGILFLDGTIGGLWTSILAILIGCAAGCAICLRKKGIKHRRKRYTG